MLSLRDRKFLIVGLGNPGEEYEGTRHNVGFEVLRRFAASEGVYFKRSSSVNGKVAPIRIRENEGYLLLPTTFMNASGYAVKRCLQEYQIAVDDLLVVCDDAALDFGVLRMRPKGSSGGQNGLRDIETVLNTQEYARLRVGIGYPTTQDLADYVLSPFSSEERERLKKVEEEALELLKVWITAGIAEAMRQVNRFKEEKK